MTGPKVVILGAGIVGASLADELTARGWTDVTVLDAGPLPAAGGSSSHAPGNVFQTNPVKVMTDFARYTVAKLSSLPWQGGPCYLPVGGLEVASTPERVAELQRRHGFATSWSLPGARLLDAEETAKTWDLLDPARVLGSLYVPDDGVAKPVRAIAAQLDRASERGATVRGGCEVLDIRTANGRVSGVITGDGTVEADLVVCCAGIWGPKLTALVDLALPLTPLAHQFAWIAPLAALSGHTAEATRPILRHQDHDLYYRENGTALGIGYYGHRPMPVSPDAIAPWATGEGHEMPSVLPFTPADFAPAMAETARLIPCTEGIELARPFNGLFSFTTDNLPLLGRHPSLDGFWVAEAVWITHAGGVAAAMAEWMIEGQSSFDLHGCDLNRFETHQLAPAYVEAKNCHNFVEVYDIVHPLQPMEQLRPLRTSPFYPRQQQLGAVFGEANGWERPHWYAQNHQLLGSDRNPGWTLPPFDQDAAPEVWASRYWSPTVAAEASITRTDVAIYDMTALKRLEVSGPGATAFLSSMVTANIAKSVGSITYCLLLNAAGRIRSDIAVARLGPERYRIGANGQADLVWLQQHLPAPSADSAVTVRDITAGTCCIGIWGPKARDVVQPLTDADFSATGLKYFRAKDCFLGTVAVTAMRLSYVGELGYELYTGADQGLALWDLLMHAGGEHGIIAAGRSASKALRIEKGYRSYGTDMTTEHTPAEAGLSFAVNTDRGDFLGRDAVLAQGEPTQKLTALRIDDPAGVLQGAEPVYSESGEPVGYVTSAAYAYTLGFPLAYAWLPTELSTAGTTLGVGYFDRVYPATVLDEPVFDPDMTKIRR